VLVGSAAVRFPESFPGLVLLSPPSLVA
jgi:hypothetical protein